MGWGAGVPDVRLSWSGVLGRAVAGPSVAVNNLFDKPIHRLGDDQLLRPSGERSSGDRAGAGDNVLRRSGGGLAGAAVKQH